MTKKYDDAFILNGFDNWKKAEERFKHHQVSECHREAQPKLKSMQAPTIRNQLVTQAKKDQAETGVCCLNSYLALNFCCDKAWLFVDTTTEMVTYCS